jgi:hypothetical protein
VIVRGAWSSHGPPLQSGFIGNGLVVELAGVAGIFSAPAAEGFAACAEAEIGICAMADNIMKIAKLFESMASM